MLTHLKTTGVSPILILILLYAVTACKSTEIPITIDPSPIKISMDLVKVVDDKVKVTIRVPDFNQDIISYYVPEIVPGTYQKNDFGKYIDDLQAFDDQGSPIFVQRNGINHWKINNGKKLKTITYWVNDTFDTEGTHNVFSPTGTNISQNKNFILNLYAFIGYFDGMKEKKYELEIQYPKAMEGSSSLIPSKIKEITAETRYNTDVFKFRRYADLADSPIMYAIPDRVTFTINDIEVLLSVYSPNNVHRAAQLMPQMERMIRAQKNFLGATNTTKKYSILLYLSSAKNDDAKGFGALEHNTSTLVVLPESIPIDTLNESLIDIVSHEFFHIVTPLSIHSEEIHNFDYNIPKMSKHLWLYEGTTEYFSLLFQIHQGLISKNDFFNRILEKIETSKSFDDTMSFTLMSKNILQEPYLSNYRNVYEKGALISMCIDIIIREQSGGVRGIIDLVKRLADTYGSEIPFKDDELISSIGAMSYPEVTDFLQKHVEGNTPIDYEFYLNKAGISYGVTEVPSSYFIHEQEPFIQGSEATNEVIFSSGIPLNNFLKNIGVKGGDALLKINKKKYNLKNIYDLFSDSNTWKIGNTIKFIIRRGEEVITLSTKVIKPTVEKIVLQQNPKASETQLRVLKNWIND
ncbi:peptidase M61 [Aquimarina addita]|uniref:Peptidase M61 n=1 Tax=Aquimarina addita TaxID=870485 RepID=A0ABP7X8S4_9FLAO